MQIVEYDPKYRQSFVNFNIGWLMDNFGYLEPSDRHTFDHIDEKLTNGAMIYFAVEDDIPLACCMAKPLEGDTWEICKFASTKSRPHKGCGSAVFEAAMNWAKDHGAKRLYLISNSGLKAAIHIYRKFGFQEVPLDTHEYARGDIAFEKILE